jgi:hypothetical protein
MDRHALYLSSAFAVATWVWDAYCQAHGIPYKIDDTWKGIIMAPFGKWTIDKSIELGQVVIAKLPRRKKKEP